MTWYSVAKVTIAFETGLPSESIYANSRNQVGVIVTIWPEDENHNSITVDQSHLAANTWLIDYVDESELNWKGQSSWCYTDTEDPHFNNVPNLAGISNRRQPVVSHAAEGGAQQLKYYVYCSPGVSGKSIAVKVKSDSGEVTVTSQNSGQSLQSKVSLVPKQAVNYDLDNIDWVREDLVSLRQDDTQYVNFEGGSNWYLTAKENSEGRVFCHFEVSNVVTDNQYDGFYGWQSGKDNFNAKWWSLLCGAYVWYQEPHDVKYPANGFSANSNSANPGGGASAVILKMPNGNKWWDAAKIYDRSADADNQSLCVTWANAGTGGDGWVQNQPNPLQSGTPLHGPNDIHNYYNPKIVAYDQYGNSGTFYLDGHDGQYGGIMKLYTSAPPAPY